MIFCCVPSVFLLVRRVKEVCRSAVKAVYPATTSVESKHCSGPLSD